LRAGGARADMGKVDLKGVGELHTVIAPGEVWHRQNLRSFIEVEPADRKERVVVHANTHQIRAAGRLRSEGLCKEFWELRVERIDRDGAIAEALLDDRSLEGVVHEVWPKVDEEERAHRPCHDHDRGECNEMFVLHSRYHCVSTTSDILYLPPRIVAPGRYHDDALHDVRDDVPGCKSLFRYLHYICYGYMIPLSPTSASVSIP